MISSAARKTLHAILTVLLVFFPTSCSNTYTKEEHFTGHQMEE